MVRWKKFIFTAKLWLQKKKQSQGFHNVVIQWLIGISLIDFVGWSPHKIVQYDLHGLHQLYRSYFSIYTAFMCHYNSQRPSCIWGDGSSTGTLWNCAHAVSCWPFCGREAWFATNIPGSPLFGRVTLSSLSIRLSRSFAPVNSRTPTLGQFVF